VLLKKEKRRKKGNGDKTRTEFHHMGKNGPAEKLRCTEHFAKKGEVFRPKIAEKGSKKTQRRKLRGKNALPGGLKGV